MCSLSPRNRRYETAHTVLAAKHAERATRRASISTEAGCRARPENTVPHVAPETNLSSEREDPGGRREQRGARGNLMDNQLNMSGAGPGPGAESKGNRTQPLFYTRENPSPTRPPRAQSCRQHSFKKMHSSGTEGGQTQKPSLQTFPPLPPLPLLRVCGAEEGRTRVPGAAH